MQWGLGVIAPDLQEQYDLSAASLGALVNATAFGNAVALIVAGVIVDRSGPRKPLLYAGSACGFLLIAGSLLTNPVGLGIALFASGVAGALVAVGATVSVFHGFPPERRGFALGMRQMSVALGGLLAAVLLPLAVHVGGVRLALLLSGVLTAITAIVFALDTPRGPLVPPEAARRVIAPFAVLREPGMGMLLVVAVCYIVALVAVLTFAVPAVRDGGAGPGEGSVLFALVSISAMVARIAWGRLADAGGGRRRVATLRDVGVLGCAVRLADLGGLARGHGRPDRSTRPAQLRCARLQRRALPDRRGDRGRGAGGPGGGADVDGALRRRRARRGPARCAGRRRGLSQPVARGGRGLRARRAGDVPPASPAAPGAVPDGDLARAPHLCCLRGCAVSGRTGARAHRRLARSGWARRRAP